MATLATNVSFQCLGLDGKPLAGGKVYTYEAGTTTPKNTYTTMAGDVPNSNPVILDQNGKAKIFLGDGAYRMRILDSNDALIDDINQISCGHGSGSSFNSGFSSDKIQFGKFSNRERSG